jgi:hypothetical protein
MTLFVYLDSNMQVAYLQSNLVSYYVYNPSNQNDLTAISYTFTFINLQLPTCWRPVF